MTRHDGNQTPPVSPSGRLPQWAVIGGIGAFVLVGMVLGIIALLSFGGSGVPGNRTGGTPSAVIVPSFVGRSADDARRMAAESGLQVRTETREDAGSPPGTVIDQDPPVGRTIASGGAVRLTISSAAPGLSAPDLRGLTLEEARQALSRSGLHETRTTERPGPPQERGRIVGQDPPAGTQVAPGSGVALLVGIEQQTPTATPGTPTASATPNTPASTATRPAASPPPAATATPPARTPTVILPPATPTSQVPATVAPTAVVPPPTVAPTAVVPPPTVAPTAVVPPLTATPVPGTAVPGTATPVPVP